MHVIADIDDNHPTPWRTGRARPTTAAGAPRPAGHRPAPDQRPRPERAPMVDPARITALCEEQIGRLLTGPADIEDAGHPALAELRGAVETWSRQGVSLEAMHRAAAIALDRTFDVLVRGIPRDEPQQLVGATRRLLKVRAAVSSTLAASFVAQVPHVADPVPALPLRAVAAHLLVEEQQQQQPVTTDACAVLAVAIPEVRDEDSSTEARAQAGQQRLQRVRAALAEHCGAAAVAVLGARGGTVLVPAAAHTDEQLGELVGVLSEAAGVRIAAVALRVQPAHVRAAADYAHELLDTAQRLQYPGGLYKYTDLAVEHQLTRPGPARDKLRSILDALQGYPDLLQTLLIHIYTDLSRRDTAQVLKLHRNTIDYRLRRIQELTGYDPTRQSGLWYLRAALVAHAYCDRNRGAGRISG
jgi:hypothetical protein